MFKISVPGNFQQDRDSDFNGESISIGRVEICVCDGDFYAGIIKPPFEGGGDIEFVKQ